MIKKYVVSMFFVFTTHLLFAQQYDEGRIQQLENKLTAISSDIPGLSEKLDITMQQANLSTFLLAISEVHTVNIDVSPDLQGIQIINNFKDVLVSDVLVYLCKNYNLKIDFTGTILYIDRVKEEKEEETEKEILVSYSPNNQLVSADLQNDNLSRAFKTISDLSGKGIFYTPELKDKSLSVFIKDLPFDIAMEKIAYSNNLVVSQSKDGSYEFESAVTKAPGGPGGVTTSRPAKSRRSNFFFEVINLKEKRINVDIQNIAIADIIYDIGNELKIDIFTASPLETAGRVTVTAKDISFDQLLTKIFENTTLSIQSANKQVLTSSPNRPAVNGQQVASTAKRFTFKKDGNIYYFGTFKQLTLRASEVVPLRFRSISILADPQSSGRSAGRSGLNYGRNSNFVNGGSIRNNNQNTNVNFNNQSNTQLTGQSSQNQNNTDLGSLIPQDVKQDLNIIVDKELNSFIVSGASADIKRFKEFIQDIDKQVPIVIIEVMILEVSKNSTLDAGIEWGIGQEPSVTQGNIFPNTNLSLGASTINRILGRIDGSSFFNIGQVGPNFFATIRASETNGNFNIKSSPRITTLNGHRAYFSNGRTSYYEITQNQFVGVQNPVVSESVDYVPIDAELSLEVLPFVSEDGEVTMDIKVIQSSFSGERVTENGPPEISSREFTSIIKSRTNDIVVLGGLEEDSKNNSGSGVPFLARIPIIKWLFSKRVRTASKSKLTVLIKPTVIY
ncbi:general secretion pathway protein D [Dokdonia sp. MED134]|uniref:type II secretion system protein GspD n=1 Tax=Dokdonia sp. MED134 TaxID=313590 RepID=UPI000068CF1C|nr:hypothetical protein [Dokdonia sp. MED134]EAQ39508.1 general secretion pathway protein D [Dokdonia sp. MED134]